MRSSKHVLKCFRRPVLPFRERESDGWHLARQAVCFSILLFASSTMMVGVAGAQTRAPPAVAQAQEAVSGQPNAFPADARPRVPVREELERRERALRESESRLGREHPDTLKAVNHFAQGLLVQGRNAEAEPLLLRLLEASERVLGREHNDTINTVADLGYTYRQNGRYSEAEPLLLRALEASERLLGREHPDTLGSLSSLAVLYDSQGRYAEAEPLLLRALEAAQRGGFALSYVMVGFANNLAELYRAQGRFAEAEPLYLSVMEEIGPWGIVYEIAPIGLATMYRSQGRYPEAEPVLLRALERSQQSGGSEQINTLLALTELGILYRSQARYAEAEPLFLRVIEARGRRLGQEHPDTLLAVSELATLYSGQGRYAEAEPLFMGALEARKRVLGGKHPATAESAASLGTVRLARPATAPFAIDPARLAVASLHLRFASTAGGYAEPQRHGEGAPKSDYYLLLADAAWAAAATAPGDPAAFSREAFATLQDAVAGTTSRAVIQKAIHRFADNIDSRIGALVRERESLSAQRSANSRNYAHAVAHPFARVENLKVLADRRDELEARMTETDAVLRRDFPQYFALVRPEALDVAATQALLAPDEAVLLVVPAQFGTHVMAVSQTGFQWVRSEWTREQVSEAVGRLLRDISVTMAQEGYSYDRRTAYALYRELVVPVASVLKGKRHVFIATAGSLTSIPFGILVTQEPQGADDDPRALRSTRWFADAHALIQIPSIQSLQFLRRFGQGPRAAGDTANSFVGFGDPVLQGQAMVRGRGRGTASIASVFSGRQTRSGGALADINQIRLLSRLPGTAVELENMRSALQAPVASLFLAERATEHALRAMDLSRTRVLVLATHGLVAGEVRGASEPGLVFTPPETSSEQDDGFLTASEVSSLRLDADWVILSACNTAAGDGSEGAPGFSGLARAFFYAGARNLLASHWPVVDEAAPRLTVRMIELMRENPALSRAKALQRSMREIRRDRTRAAWAHPGVWAPFSLIGDGAR